MRRLKILCWHIHGSYLNALCRVDQDWYLPIKPGLTDGYGGRSKYDLPSFVREIPAEQVRDLDLDLIVYQTPRNLHEDAPELLGDRQREIPGIYLEHNTPLPHPVESRHPAADSDLLIVHVSHYNRLMWDNGTAETRVIEHSVAIDPAARYTGELARGITVVNDLPSRGRKVGRDIFEQVRQRVPLDLVGIASDQIGGLGDIPYPKLHAHIAQYRFVFSPIRYTSMPLAVVEAMTVGCPIVALATTELPTVIENGVTGYVSCELDELVARMQKLLADPALAHRLSGNARELARRRFGFDRFARDWQAAFAAAIDRQRPRQTQSVLAEAGSRAHGGSTI